MSYLYLDNGSLTKQNFVNQREISSVIQVDGFPVLSAGGKFDASFFDVATDTTKSEAIVVMTAGVTAVIGDAVSSYEIADYIEGKLGTNDDDEPASLLAGFVKSISGQNATVTFNRVGTCKGTFTAGDALYMGKAGSLTTIPTLVIGEYVSKVGVSLGGSSVLMQHEKSVQN